MVTQQVLEEVSQGLEKLMKQYKQNLKSGDKERFELTKQAHAALRKIILMTTIKGDIVNISPIKKGAKAGWVVVDSESNIKNYC